MSKDYEVKRKWLLEWRCQYPFAEYDVDAKIMYCSTWRSVPTKANGNTLFLGVNVNEKITF